MVNSKEIIARVEEVRSGSMLVVETGSGSPLFTARVLPSSGTTEDLTMSWHTTLQPGEFRKAVGEHLGANVRWNEGVDALWGTIENGGFWMQKPPFITGDAPRVYGELRLGSARGIGSAVNVAATVVSVTIAESGALDAGLVSRQLRNFLKTRSAGKS
jgi:hypothetical protein